MKETFDDDKMFDKRRLECLLNSFYDRVFNAKSPEDESIQWHKLLQRSIAKIDENNGVPDELKDFVEIRYYEGLFRHLHDRLMDYTFDGKSVLEVGSGYGLLSFYLYRSGANCTLLDNSEIALHYSRKLFNHGCDDEERDRKRFVRADCTKMPFDDESFDIVHSMGLIEHSVVNPDQVLEESIRVTKVGGRIIFGVPNYFSPELIAIWSKYGKGTERYFSKKELKELYLSHGIKDVSVASSNFVFPFFTPRFIVENCSFLEDILAKKFGLGFLNIAVGTKNDYNR